MKLPRDLTGRDLVVSLRDLGYQVVGQASSHIYLTTQQGGEHHLCIPDHHPLRAGTLNKILRQVAEHHGLEREQVLRRLFS